MTRRRLALLAIALVLVGLGAVGWATARVRSEAEAVDVAMGQLTLDVRRLEVADTQADLGTLRERAAALDAAANSWLLSPAYVLPRVGDDVRAVQVTARAVDEVAQSTQGLDAALPELAPSRLRGPSGRINVAELQAVAPELAKLSAAMASARTELDGIDTNGLIGPVVDAVRRAQQTLATAPEAVTAFAAAPGLLGADGPRTYAVLLLNPAELRGGGGFFGGYAIVKADHGGFTLEKVGPNDDLVKAGALNVSSLPKEYRQLWGESALEWQSVNISPNFPYAGELTREGFARLGIRVDDVIALDSKVAAALLAGTGPVTTDRVTITSKDADAYFTKGIYAQYPDGAGHKAQALALFAQLFTKLTTGPLDMKAMASALAPLTEQRRLLLWSSDPKVEAVFAAVPVGGTVPDVTGPWTTVSLINGAGNKMDAYVKARVSFLSNRCTTSSSSSTVTLQLANLAPDDLPPYVDQRLDAPTAPKGSTLLLAYVYGPVGSALVSADLDGTASSVQVGVERGHPVWRFSVALLRGQSRTLTVKFAEPHDGAASAVVMAQPMEMDETTSATSIACG